MRLKSSTYYKMIKDEARKKEKLALGIKVQNEMTEYREQSQQEISETSQHYREFAEYRLKLFNDNIKVYATLHALNF